MPHGEDDEVFRLVRCFYPGDPSAWKTVAHWSDQVLGDVIAALRDDHDFPADPRDRHAVVAFLEEAQEARRTWRRYDRPS